MSQSKLNVQEKINILLEAMEGDKKINEILSKCKDSESMIIVLIEFSARLKLELSKEDLTKNPPIRDWIWYKDGGALLTVGDGIPRYQQDKNSANLRFIGGGLLIALLFALGMLTGF